MLELWFNISSLAVENITSLHCFVYAYIATLCHSLWEEEEEEEEEDCRIKCFDLYKRGDVKIGG